MRFSLGNTNNNNAQQPQGGYGTTNPTQPQTQGGFAQPGVTAGLVTTTPTSTTGFAPTTNPTVGASTQAIVSSILGTPNNINNATAVPGAVAGGTQPATPINFTQNTNQNQNQQGGNNMYGNNVYGAQVQPQVGGYGAAPVYGNNPYGGTPTAGYAVPQQPTGFTPTYGANTYNAAPTVGYAQPQVGYGTTPSYGTAGYIPSTMPTTPIMTPGVPYSQNQYEVVLREFYNKLQGLFGGTAYGTYAAPTTSYTMPQQTGYGAAPVYGNNPYGGTPTAGYAVPQQPQGGGYGVPNAYGATQPTGYGYAQPQGGYGVPGGFYR